MRVVERDDSCKANENVGVERKKLFDKFRSACKAMDVDVAVVQVRGAEHGEGIVVCFAEVQYERFSAFNAELQVAFEKLDLGLLCFCAVMVIEPEFSAGNALGVLQEFHHAGFVFGGLCFDVFGVNAISGVDERIFFAENACGFEVGGVACHMDERFWLRNFCGCCLFFGGAESVGKACVFEAGEECVERFAGMAFVRINMAMSIDEHGGGEWLG